MAGKSVRYCAQVAVLTSTSVAVCIAVWFGLRQRARKNGCSEVRDIARLKKKAPSQLHSGFDPAEIVAWDPTRFRFVRLLQSAERNHGQVNLMYDTARSILVAVKQVPNWWMCGNHGEFMEKHAEETELPWQDIGCVRFLEAAGYQYLCRLQCVARDENHTYLVFAYATEGDLFNMATAGLSPGVEREWAFHPLVRQILEGVRELHELSVVHRDISPENLLCSLDSGQDKEEIRIIDFGMALATRYTSTQGRAAGKPSYIAPEMHQTGDYDAFLADAFSVGVVIYSLLVQDYPWITTKPKWCKRFQFVVDHGLRSYMAKQKLRGTKFKVGERLSEPLKELLVGLLELDPARRLTLGESSFQSGRRSAWDCSWVQHGPELRTKATK